MSAEAKVHAAGHMAMPYSELLKLKKFPKQQEAKQLGIVKPIQQFDKVIFVSHRWMTAAHPDPNGLQLECIKEHVKHYYEMPGRPALEYSDGMGWHIELDYTGAKCQYHGVEQENIRAVFIDADKSKLGIWYDYACMPQKERTAPEQQAFKQQLETLDDLLMCRNVYTMVLEDGDYSNRAWCVVEALIGGSQRPLILNGHRNERGGVPKIGAVDDKLRSVTNQLLQEAGIVNDVNAMFVSSHWDKLGFVFRKKSGNSGGTRFHHPSDPLYVKATGLLNPQFDVKKLAAMVVSPLRVTNDGDKAFIAEILAKYLSRSFSKPKIIHAVLPYGQ